ncbi:MAG TPA: ABC transporter ATP-binding protein, partial [Draconibacterium sp.]|nr:ABC transporter ATP-binding protein [Draconibacterium sp.]
IPVIGKRKKPFRALNGVSLEINTGMFGLLGPNGAGKSTMMRIICGILEQSYGKIWINGMDTQKYREELQGLIGYLPQAFGTYENMSAWEFLDYQAILKGIKDTKTRDERIDYVLKSVHMYERRNDKIGAFSGGMKQRIGIAQILLNLPRILVVDEPTAGLDPRERIRFRNLLVELSRERIVIFSTHIIEDISSSCNQVAVINRGDLKYFGTPTDMVHMGTGFVWQFTIPAKEFDNIADKKLIVHHMRDGENIRVRCLSMEKPTEDAVNVSPHLEDAYLCLLKDFKKQ